MLTLTVAFKRTPFFSDTKITDWLGAVFTLDLAGFTWALVSVASKQTEILSHTDTALNAAASAQIASSQTAEKLAQISSTQTDILASTDKALHAAAAAQTASAETAEKLRLFTEATERPWIGPNGAAIEGTLESGKRISTGIMYQNTGRQPATLIINSLPKLIDKASWGNGLGLAAARTIFSWEQTCMGETIPASRVNVRIAYPTTGFSAYRLQVYSDDATLAPSDRFLATKEVMSGDQIFVFLGCFVYGTPENTHHSAFCFYFDHESSDVHNLSYCQVGQRND